MQQAALTVSARICDWVRLIMEKRIRKTMLAEQDLLIMTAKGYRQGVLLQSFGQL